MWEISGVLMSLSSLVRFGVFNTVRLAGMTDEGMEEYLKSLNAKRLIIHVHQFEIFAIKSDDRQRK